MRLHFQLSPNRAPIPFNYVSHLTRILHDWLGRDNQWHDGISLYSLGWLQNGRSRGGALDFPNGARWMISAPDTPGGQDFLNRIAQGALSSPGAFGGMEIIETSGETTPDFGPRRVFRANSPIFIRGDKLPDPDNPTKFLDKHILWDDPKSGDYLTKTLRHKLDKAGLSHLSDSAKVAFDLSYRAPKSKLITVKDDFRKRASFCPVIVEGDPEAVKFAWCVGVGNGTGMGFGSLI